MKVAWSNLYSVCKDTPYAFTFVYVYMIFCFKRCSSCSLWAMQH